MILNWLLLGLAGWASLWLFRVFTEGVPKFGDIPLYGYAKGIIFSLILGPLCFFFLGFLIFERMNSND